MKEYFELTSKDGSKQLVSRKVNNIFPDTNFSGMSEEERKQFNEREAAREIVRLPRIEILTKAEFFWRFYGVVI